MSVLFLVRGLPGSGKTSLANILAAGVEAFGDTAFSVATDEFFEDGEGGYNFDPARLEEAHTWCQLRVADAFQDGYEVVIVHNTFSQPWEAEPYFKLAEMFGVGVFIIETQNKFPNEHGVPQRAIDNMRARWLPLI